MDPQSVSRTGYRRQRYRARRVTGGSGGRREGCPRSCYLLRIPAPGELVLCGVPARRGGGPWHERHDSKGRSEFSSLHSGRSGRWSCLRR